MYLCGLVRIYIKWAGRGCIKKIYEDDYGDDGFKGLAKNKK